jgi:beta-N-acetylhexosaminidase
VKPVIPSWAVNSAVDSLSSGLSTYRLKTELRGNLGLKRVIISDAIEAGALKAYGSYLGRAIKAAAAVVDLTLASVLNDSQGITIVMAIASALWSAKGIGYCHG